MGKFCTTLNSFLGPIKALLQETQERRINHNTIILQFNTIITMYVKEEAEFETKLKHIYDLIPVALYSIYLKKIFISLLHFLLFYIL